jgi:dihydroxyacetone kinase DhaKLM complex PTS-EIIA-like component DhaM
MQWQTGQTNRQVKVDAWLTSTQPRTHQRDLSSTIHNVWTAKGSYRAAAQAADGAQHKKSIKEALQQRCLP